jgi:hypothetical protein
MKVRKVRLPALIVLSLCFISPTSFTQSATIDDIIVTQNFDNGILFTVSSVMLQSMIGKTVSFGFWITCNGEWLDDSWRCYESELIENDPAVWTSGISFYYDYDALSEMVDSEDRLTGVFMILDANKNEIVAQKEVVFSIDRDEDKHLNYAGRATVKVSVESGKAQTTVKAKVFYKGGARRIAVSLDFERNETTVKNGIIREYTFNDAGKHRVSAVWSFPNGELGINGYNAVVTVYSEFLVVGSGSKFFIAGQKQKDVVPPVIRAIKQNGNSIEILWNAVANAEGYYIYRSENGKENFDDYDQLDRTTDTLYSDLKIRPQGIYYYYVIACTSNNQSFPSNRIKASLKKAFVSGPAFVSVSGIPGPSGGFIVSWNTIPGAGEKDRILIYIAESPEGPFIQCDYESATSRFKETTGYTPIIGAPVIQFDKPFFFKVRYQKEDGTESDESPVVSGIWPHS